MTLLVFVESTKVSSTGDTGGGGGDDNVATAPDVPSVELVAFDMNFVRDGVCRCASPPPFFFVGSVLHTDKRESRQGSLIFSGDAKVSWRTKPRERCHLLSLKVRVAARCCVRRPSSTSTVWCDERNFQKPIKTALCASFGQH